MGMMNKSIGGILSLAGLYFAIFQRDYILGLVSLIVGLVFIIFHFKEEEFQGRNDEKNINNNK